MEINNLGNFIGGWFIGNFDPSMFRTDSFEVSVKRYVQGEVEETHHQLRAVEFTIVVSGQCRIGDQLFGPDEIIRIDPLEAADFEAVSDVVLVAVKTPSIPSDKVQGQANVR
jgi:hypothetical protein